MEYYALKQKRSDLMPVYTVQVLEDIRNLEAKGGITHNSSQTQTT